MPKRAPLFIAILVVLDLGLAALFGRVFVRQRSGASGGLANQAIVSGAPLLILGSSRAQHHLDPEILGAAADLQAWNAGADGQGLYYATSLLDLLDPDRAPRVVVWNLDLKDFDPRLRARQLQRLSVLLPHYDESRRLRSLWQSQGYEARLKAQVRTYRFNSLVLPMLSALLEPQHPLPRGGFVPLPPHPGVAPAPGEPQIYDRPDERALAVLEEAAAQLSGRGAEVILLTAPRYAPGDPPAAFYDAVDARFESIAARHPRLSFWRMDEVAVPEFRDPELFFDDGHLNADGARRLSDLVAERIRSEIRPRLRARAEARPGS